MLWLASSDPPEGEGTSSEGRPGWTVDGPLTMKTQKFAAASLLGFSLVALMLAAASFRGPQESDAKIRSLAEERLRIVARAEDAIKRELLAPPGGPVKAEGPSRIERMIEWKSHGLEARLDLAADRAARVAALKSYVEELGQFERLVEELVRSEVSGLSSLDRDQVRLRRLEAETRLVREEAGR